MSLNKSLLLLVSFLFLIVLTSCSILDRYDPGFCERQQNFDNIKKIELGMTKKQVIAIMGSPILEEKYNKPDVWFYYTDWDWADCARTQEESIPIVFANGKVIGIGRVFHKSYAHAAWQFNDIRAKAYDTTGKED